MTADTRSAGNKAPPPSLRRRGWELQGCDRDPLSDADLARLAELVGEAHIVGFSEPWHLAAEPLLARNQIFQYLAEHLGFSTIALESGFPESRLINDYVLSGQGDLDEILPRGLTWTFDTLPQNRELITWMRTANRDGSARKSLRFYGFDLPGSPGNLTCARFYDRPLLDVLAYLETAAPSLAESFRSRLAPMIGKPDLPHDSALYLRLALERDTQACTEALVDLRDTLQREVRALEAASSPACFAWISRLAENALRLDEWLSAMPASVLAAAPRRLESEDEMLWYRGFNWSATDTDAVTAAANIRDATQADNINWISDVLAGDRKVLVFAAAAHLSAAPVRLSAMAHETWFYPAGLHLRARHGQDLVLIGATSGAGIVGAPGCAFELHQPGPNTLDGAVGQDDASSYCVDLRALPESERAAWDREFPLAHIPGYALNPIQAFDALIYFHTQSPAAS